MDGSEAFLSSSVPELSLDVDSTSLVAFDFEVDPDGADKLRCESLFCLPSEKRGLSNSRVTDEDSLDDHFVIGLVHFGHRSN